MRRDFEMENEKQIWDKIVVEKLLCFQMKEKKKRKKKLSGNPIRVYFSYPKLARLSDNTASLG